MSRKWYRILWIACVCAFLAGCSGESTVSELSRDSKGVSQNTRPMVVPPATPTTEPEVTERPETTKAPKITVTQTPGPEAELTATPMPTKKPEAEATPIPTERPQPTKEAEPEATPISTERPQPTKEAEPEATPIPTEQPEPTEEPAATSIPTELPEPTKEPDTEVTPEPKPESVKKISDVSIYTGETVEVQMAKVGDVIFFGAYEQDNVEENGAERIAWQVVEKMNNRLLLLSVYILDAQAFHNEATEVSWYSSSLNQWLQEEFYTAAFLLEEQQQIAVSVAGSVFALSIEEIQRYFSVEKSEWNLQEISDARLEAEATEYAKAREVWTMDGKACWWLRSAGENKGTAIEITENGSIYRLGTDVNYMYNGVRPAIWLDLE